MLRRRLTRRSIEDLAANRLVDESKVDAILEFLKNRPLDETETRFDIVHLLYYLGAATIVASLWFFASKVKDELSGTIFGLVLAVYSAASIILAFVEKRHLGHQTVFGGVLALIGILLGVWGFLEIQSANTEVFVSIFSSGDETYDGLSFGRRLLHTPLFAVILGTICAIYGIRRTHFIPLIVPAALGCWYILLDCVMPLSDSSAGITLSIIGFGTVLVGWVFDLVAEANFGYWVNKLGMWLLPFALALAFKDTGLVAMTLFACINGCLIFLALFLQRPAGVLGGAGGLLYYLTYLYDKYFEESMLFPFFITALGAIIMFAGWKLYRSGKSIDVLLPQSLVNIRPPERLDPVVFGA